LNDKYLKKFLSENSDHVKYLYQNSSASQKDGFRHKINELRKTDDVVDGLGFAVVYFDMITHTEIIYRLLDSNAI